MAFNTLASKPHRFESHCPRRTHGAHEVFGDGGCIWAWGLSTFENWQSESLQLLTFVVLTAYLVHKGSHESKDTDEKFEAQLNRIERRLDRLTRRQSGLIRASLRADTSPTR